MSRAASPSKVFLYFFFFLFSFFFFLFSIRKNRSYIINTILYVPLIISTIGVLIVTISVLLTVALSPLQVSIWFVTFTPNILTIQKAFSDFRARISFSYLYLLIKGSIKARLIIYLAFILLICCDVNTGTVKYCVFLA